MDLRLTTSLSQTQGVEQCGWLPQSQPCSRNEEILRNLRAITPALLIFQKCLGSRNFNLPLQDKRGLPWNPNAQFATLEPSLPLQPQCTHIEKGELCPEHISGCHQDCCDGSMRWGGQGLTIYLEALLFLVAFYYTKRETKTQRGQRTTPRSHTKLGSEVNIAPRFGSHMG